MAKETKFSEIVAMWKDDKRLYVKKSTMANYSFLIKNYILPEFGHRTTMTENDLKQFIVRKYDEGKSMKYVKDIRARYWYMMKAITGHWTTRYLQEAIRLDHYGKHGALANNFGETLPAPEASEVASMLKDPYIFDMLTFTDQYNERDVEIGLVRHVEKFLLEMGAGFAFMGRQYHIEVSGDDYYIDLLMYNAFMHRYLVIELKDTEFKPEYIGKLNFYCSAVDDTLCHEGDHRTIGLLLCKTKDRIKAEYALRDISKPIGISDYELGQALPKDIKGSLPTIEEIEKELEAGRL